MIYIKKENSLSYIIVVRSNILLMNVNPGPDDKFGLKITDVNEPINDTYDSTYNLYTTSFSKINNDIDYIKFEISELYDKDDVAIPLDSFKSGMYTYEIIYARKVIDNGIFYLDSDDIISEDVVVLDTPIKVDFGDDTILNDIYK